MSDSRRQIRVGSVVQIDPSHDDVFGACFLVVSELKSWGVQGYVTVASTHAAIRALPYYSMRIGNRGAINALKCSTGVIEDGENGHWVKWSDLSRLLGDKEVP